MLLNVIAWEMYGGVRRKLLYINKAESFKVMLEYAT